MTESNGHQPEKIDLLIDQVGRLTENVNELRLGISELKDIAEAQSKSIKQLAQQQDQTVSRLVGIVESLINDRQTG
jgi:hypothetical protein